MVMVMRYFFFNDTATTEIYTLSLHDALPISLLFATGALCATGALQTPVAAGVLLAAAFTGNRSEEHTSELQSQSNLVCRLLLEKKKNKPVCNIQQAYTRDRSNSQTHSIIT